MKILNKIILLFFVLLCGCNKKNTLNLNFSENMKKSDFKIEIKVLGSTLPKKVIFDGENEYQIPNEYGENEWYFKYKDSMLAYFRHFKTNSNDIHNYNYFFKREGNNVFVIINIDGVSKMNNKEVKFTTTPLRKVSRL